MQTTSLTGLSLKAIARKIAPVLCLNLAIWFVAAIVKYPLVLKQKIDWEQVYIETFLFSILFTIFIEFKRIKTMVRLIRSGQLS